MNRVWVYGLVVAMFLLVACSGDSSDWPEERAKAVLADFLNAQEVVAWRVRLGADSYSVRGDAEENGPRYADVIDWIAEYQQEGVWRVAGKDLGEYRVFETGPNPIKVDDVCSACP